MYKILIIILAIFTFKIYCFAQSQIIVSENWYDLSIIDSYVCSQGNSIIVDCNGNIIIAGETDTPSLSSTISQNFTIKYDSTGNKLWEKRIPIIPDGKIYGGAIKSTLDKKGNIYILGYIFNQENSHDISIIKYDENGIEKWHTLFNNKNKDIGRDIFLDNEGNITVSGYITNNDNNKDLMLVKYDTNGVELWNATFDSLSNEEAFSHLVDRNNGDIYVTGYLYGETSDDIATFKYNKSGKKEWGKFYNGKNNENDRGIIINSDKFGNIYVAGSSNNNLLVIKYNKTGDELWTFDNKNYHPMVIETPIGLEIDNESNIYVADQKYLLKININGQLQWSKKFNGELYALTQDTIGCIYLTGAIERCGNIVTYKINPDGQEQWHIIGHNYKKYSRTFEYGHGLQIDVNNSGIIGVVAFGVFRDSTSAHYKGYGTIVISYKEDINQTVKFREIDTELVSSYSLSQNYPNPFNSSTKIKYILRKPNNVILKIFNLAGVEIETIVNSFQSAGEHELNWRPKNLSSGIYFCRLQIGEFSETKKLILQK